MMNRSSKKEFARSLLREAGIELNGTGPADLQIHNEGFYDLVLREGSLGLGESYMKGWWDCANLDQFCYQILRANLENKIRLNLRLIFYFLRNRILNQQRKSKAFELKHYDIGNELYEKMLDKRMTYTCGYWKNAKDLDSAQEAKLELVCRKAQLKTGMRVLDIGCGWGSFMKYAAQNYGVKCDGISISPAQIELGEKLCKGLPINFYLKDYRDLNEQYDAIVSLGMFEHVGPNNYRAYFEVANKCLKDTGIFLLHTIGANKSNVSGVGDPWIDKYIFPKAILPSIKQISEAIEGLFVVEDLHNFGADYDKTLMSWYYNFESNWPALKASYDQTFYRMWKYYLLMCAGTFRARRNQLWQLVLSKNGLVGGYESLR